MPFLEKKEDSIQMDALDQLQVYVEEYAEKIKNEVITDFLENIKSEIDDSINDLKTNIEEKKAYYIGDCCKHFFKDETFFKIILENILEPYLKEIFSEKEYNYPELSDGIAEEFYERIKNLNKYPEIKEIFINIQKEFEKENEK